jgi:UDP-galactopyranose mutase
MKQCDVLIVGAGYAGLVLAERLSNELGKHVLVVDKRNHIGGQAYDSYDAAGVLIHNYGGHLFHTDSDRILEYLSKFTGWLPRKYEMKVFTDGKYWNFPISLFTFEQWIGRSSTTEEFEAFLESVKVPIDHPKNSEEAIISKVGWKLYQKFYEGYTKKQWERSPKELDASVCARVPIRTTRDDNYFKDKYNCMPLHGYTAMFKRMVNNPKIEFLLGTSYRDVQKEVQYKHLVYTGSIDEYFDYAYGPLPYRTVRFEFESFDKEQLKSREAIAGKPGFWQPVCHVNYPNSEAFTRIIEMKHHTGQVCDSTTIMREYPATYTTGVDPFYPIPAPDAAALYKKYKERAGYYKNVSFVGRLATYRYLDMHQAVANALAEFEKLKKVL